MVRDEDEVFANRQLGQLVQNWLISLVDSIGTTNSFHLRAKSLQFT